LRKKQRACFSAEVHKKTDLLRSRVKTHNSFHTFDFVIVVTFVPDRKSIFFQGILHQISAKGKAK